MTDFEAIIFASVVIAVAFFAGCAFAYCVMRIRRIGRQDLLAQQYAILRYQRDEAIRQRDAANFQGKEV